MTSKESAIAIDDSDDDDVVVIGVSNAASTAHGSSSHAGSRPGSSAACAPPPPVDVSLSARPSNFWTNRAQDEADRLARRKALKRSRGEKSSDEEEAPRVAPVHRTTDRPKFGSMSTLHRPPTPEPELTEARPSSPSLMSAAQVTTNAEALRAGSDKAAVGAVGSSGRYRSVPVMPESVKPVTQEQRFWKATVKLSQCDFASPDQRGVSLDSFILPTTAQSSAGLKHAILASYCADLPWISSLFPADDRGGAVDLLFVTHAGRDGPKGLVPFPFRPTWKVLFPDASSGGFPPIMHMKFLLLAYPGSHLRFCLLTGNMVQYDWNYLENIAYIQDFRWVGKIKGPACELSGQLQDVLRKLEVKSSHPVFNALSVGEYDLSTADFHLVSSAPTGVKSGWDEVQTTGLGRLAAVLKQMGFKAKPGGVQLEVQGSSLGQYKIPWLRQFHAVASGLSMRGTIPLRADTDYPRVLASIRGNAYSGPHAAQAARPGVDAKGIPAIKILFPSHTFVDRESIQGPNGAGSFFGKTYHDTQISALLHTPHSKRAPILMHAKSILALHPGAELCELDDIAPPSTFLTQLTGGQTLGSGSASIEQPDLKRKAREEPEVGERERSVTESESESVTEEETDEEDAATPAFFRKRKPLPQKSRQGASLATEESDPLAGWVYMGSHNFTQAAWGNLSGSSAYPKLSQKNWELGLVLPIRGSDLAPSAHGSLARAVLAYKRQTTPYGPRDTTWISPPAD